MKLRKLLTGLFAMGVLFSLASCDFLGDEPSNNNSQIGDPSNNNSSNNNQNEDTIKYTVTFDTKGGSSVTPQTVVKGEKATKPADPTKDGYTFGGWYSSEFFILEYSFSNKVTSDVTIYAKWNEIPKTMSYETGTPTVDLWTNSINTKWMKIAVPVTNTGETNIYLADISVDIEDTNGKLLQTVTYINAYPEYIKPGETAYYYEETTCDFTEINVKAVSNVQVEKSKKDVIRYDISDVSINADTYNGVKIIGRVQNNTPSTGSLVKVAVNLYDSNGKLICNCFTYLENDLEAGAKVGFSVTPYSFRNVAPEDVARYEIYAYPQQFNW